MEDEPSLEFGGENPPENSAAHVQSDVHPPVSTAMSDRVAARDENSPDNTESSNTTGTKRRPAKKVLSVQIVDGGTSCSSATKSATQPSKSAKVSFHYLSLSVTKWLRSLLFFFKKKFLMQ